MNIFLRFTWELPQTLLCLFLLMFYKKTLLRKVKYKDQLVYIYDKFPGGISLGYFVLVDYNREHLDCNDNCYVRMRLSDSIKHEYGHSIQSRIFGPLYLIVIGLQSAIWNLYWRSRPEWNKPDYYSHYIERWADKLGGVIRK